MAQQITQIPNMQLVTRLFLSPAVHQSLAILQFGANQLTTHLSEIIVDNPLISLHQPTDIHQSNDLSWLPDQNQESLSDHLLTQVRFVETNAMVRSALMTLCLEVDNAGYLRRPLAEIATFFQLNEQHLITALSLLKQFEPVGVGAKDLSECLMLQAINEPDFNPTALTILEFGQLDQLADDQKWPQLPYSSDDLQEALLAIQGLDPAPGHQYTATDPALYLIPDLVVKNNDQQLTIQVATDSLPQLSFDQSYYEQLISAADQQTKKYLQQKRLQYEQLDASLSKRRTTLALIGTYLADHQQPYLKTLSPAELQPINIQDCAASLGFAPSTISRAIRDKYINCQNRTFALRQLFVRSVNTALSPNALLNRITILINSESPNSPLSDQALTERLAQDQINIGRRTVTKYRKLAGFQNSYARRQTD